MNLPSDEYLVSLGEAVVRWSSLNLQCAVYVWRDANPGLEPLIDEILELAVSFEPKFVEDMHSASMPESLIERRSDLSLRRNAIIHSTVTNNSDGDARLWRPEHKGEPARPLPHEDLWSFIADTRRLKTDVAREEIDQFGRL